MLLPRDSSPCRAGIVTEHAPTPHFWLAPGMTAGHKRGRSACRERAP
jgi:hypothetical protein